MEPSLGSAPRKGRPVLANIVGLGVAGSAGVILLLVVAALYGPDAVGRFNLLFAIYVVASQVAALGVHVSVLRFVAPLPPGRTRTAVFVGAVLTVMITASLTSLTLVVIRRPLAVAYGRPELAEALVPVAVAVLLFAINKVLLASLAAAGSMGVHARLTAVRGVLMLVMLAALIAAGTTGEDLVLVLALAEGSLCVLLALATGRAFRSDGPPAGVVGWVGRHLRFGFLGAGGTLLTELNVRVDVLVLAFFAGDRIIGVYTFVATLAEAALQLPLVVRTVLGPEVVRLIDRKDVHALRHRIRVTRARLWFAMTVVAVLLIVAFPTVIALLGADAGFRDGRAALALLLLGVVVASGYVPFGLALAQGGRPLAQTGLVGALTFLNLTGNFLLVPGFGIVGAAAATALTNVASIPALRWAARRSLGIRI